jgi:integrase
LDDRELGYLWRAFDIPEPCEASCFPAIGKMLLFTGQRRGDVAGLCAEEIQDGDIWVIPGSRYKSGREHVVPLTATMRDLIARKGTKAGLVFPGINGRVFRGWGRAKARLDRRINALRAADGLGPMPGWTLHDLRRTARSLMSRAKVSADHAERVLGHALVGVRATYDRHAFLDEKRDALERLAALIDRIVNPPADVVVPFAAPATA